MPVELRFEPAVIVAWIGTTRADQNHEAGGFAGGQTYLPPELAGRRYYEPVERGLEIKIAEKLRYLRGGRGADKAGGA
jgi:putative ATPase